jgi:DNA-binding SARP family transcriptional activator
VRESVTTSFRVRLLGIPRAEIAGRPVSFATRKTVALLAYLLLERGPHSRERLSGLFWPESDAERARGALRTTLAYLRDALGPEAGRLSGDRAAIAFDRGNVEVDLDAPGADSADTFLEGLAFDDAPELERWLGVERERWRRRQVAALQQIALHHLERNDPRQAIPYAERCLALEPGDEPVLRLLLEAYLRAGQPAEAWSAYQAASDRFEGKPGRGLSSQTIVLAERARAALAPVADPSASALDRIEAAFVGRAAERLRLMAALDRLEHRPRAVVVEGEAGIGKSRLCAEFAAWASARGADVLRGRAAPPIGDALLPYATIVDALRPRLERENAPDDLLADLWLAELSRLLPELVDRYPDLPRPGTDGGAAARLFEAVARVVQALADRAPVVFLVDDLQWADGSSRDVLRYCARRWAETSSRVLLVCTVRDEVEQAWFVELERDLAVERIHLGPITTEDTLSWIGDGPGHMAFARWLHAETDGNPFFVGETLKMLVEGGVLQEQSAPDGGRGFDFEMALARETELRGILPPRVRDVIRARLARLDGPPRRVLTAAAVLGARAGTRELSAVTGIGPEAMLDVVDGLIAARWLVEDGSNAGARLRFSHDKLREAIASDLSQSRRQALHQRALEVLRLEGAPAAELAAHASAAGLVHQTIEWSIAAGEQALAVFATREAIERLDAARVLIGSDLAVDLTRRLFANLGRALELAGTLTAAREVYLELLARARARGLASLECLALNRLATLAAHAEFDLERALDLLKEAQAAAHRGGLRSDQAETHWNVAQVSYYSRELLLARANAAMALALARQIGDADLLGRCLNVSAYVLLDVGEAEAARAHAEEAIEVLHALGNRVLEVDSMAMLCGVLVVLGQAASGIAHARAALELSQRVGNTWGEVFSRYHLALGLVEQDELDESASLLEHACQLANGGAASPLLVRLVRNALGSVQRAQGRTEAARLSHTANTPAALLEPLAHASLTGDEPVRLPASALIDGLSLADLSADYACLGDWAAAADFARKLLLGVDHVPAYARLRTLWFEVAALVRAGERAAARHTLAAFVSSAGNSRRYLVTRLRAESELAHSAFERFDLLVQAYEVARELDLRLEVRELDAANRP